MRCTRFLTMSMAAVMCLQLTTPAFAGMRSKSLHTGLEHPVLEDSGALNDRLGNETESNDREGGDTNSSALPDIATDSNARPDIATGSNAKRETLLEMFPITVETGYGRNTISWSAVEDASGYEIGCSDSHDGEFKTLAVTGADVRTFTHVTGPDVKKFYKVTARKVLGNEESSIVEAAHTGLKALRQNAPIHKAFAPGDQTFDGTRVENLSETDTNVAAVLKGMAAGTVIAKIKPAGGSTGVLLGLKEDGASVPGDTILEGGSLANAKTAAIMHKRTNEIRYSFNHVRANGNKETSPGVWSTIVFTSAGPTDSKVLRLYTGGKEAGHFSGNPSHAGFFSTTAVDIDQTSVTIGGLLTPDGQTAAGFRGEIAYLTVTDEPLTDQEAQEISAGAGQSEILNAFNAADVSNTWVITGGRSAQGKYEDVGGLRNYAGIFEEVIRWDQRGNSVNGRQRFVINTAKEGYSASDIVGNYDRLIGAYQPKAVAILLEDEDLEQDASAVAASVSELITRNLEGGSPVYTVIQLPVPSLAEEKNRKIETLSAVIDGMVRQLDPVTSKKVVVADHYTQLKSVDMSRLLNESGYLNAAGHLEVANQLLAATIGHTSNIHDSDRSDIGVYAPALYPEAPVVMIEKDAVTIKAPFKEQNAAWNYEINCQGTVIKGTMGREARIGRLEEGMTFELSMVSADQAFHLPVMAGMVGEGESAYEKGDDREFTKLQQELRERLNRPEPVKWLFLGDSITHGAAHTKGYDSLPQLLEKYVREDMGRPDDVFINTAVSGATTAEFMNYKEVRYERYQDADVVVIMFGTNDAYNQLVATGSYRRNLEELVEDVRANGGIPVIRTPNKIVSPAGNRDRNLVKYVEIARKVADEKGCILADHYDLWETSLYSRAYLNTTNLYWQNDDIHPNKAGQLIMTQNLIKAMGIDKADSALSTLQYPVKVTTQNKEIVPLIKTTETSITVDASYLEKQAGAGAFGKVSLTAVAAGVTYTKTVEKTTAANLKHITMEHLPTGLDYTLTVEAELSGSPGNIRFRPRIFMLDGTVNDKIPDEMEGLIWEQEELYLDGTPKTAVDLSGDLSVFQALTQGSLHFRFRVADPEQSKDAGLQTLFSISDSTQDEVYCDFYVRANSGTIGLEMKNGTAADAVNIASGIVDMRNKYWHSVTFVSDEQDGTIKMYVDGILALNAPSSFFLNLENADHAYLGELNRNLKGKHLWPFKGDINLFQVYDRPLSQDEVLSLHEPTIYGEKEIELPDTAVKTDPIDLFYAGYSGSSSYRIPSLLTTEAGTVIAAIDQRMKHGSDYGDINTVIRRSRDSGETWGEVQTLVDLPDGAFNNSFTIDASMLQDKETGRVFLLVDMFPESTGLMNASIKIPSSGYKEVEGKRYLILKGADGSVSAGKTYTVRENGAVRLENSDGTSEPTGYTVPQHHTGELYKDGQPAGNIFLYSGNNRGELAVIKTSYLWLLSSDDDGETWSNPICLNAQVKKDWMVFLGTGPGVGIQIEHGPHKGRLLFPVYHTNANGTGGSQCSAVIYSDDNGESWNIGESPNDGRDGMSAETMNNSGKILTEAQVVEVGEEGVLKLFCRNVSGSVMVATSNDGGRTWENTVVPEKQLYDSYCQMSIIPYPQEIDGKPAYVFSNPAASNRNNGTIRIGLYDEETDTFDWKYRQLIHEGRYQYSSIAVLPDGKIGVFYEGDVPNMRFTKMTSEWITAPRSTGIDTAITNVTMEKREDRVIFQVEFNRPMMKTGSPVLKLRVNGSDKNAQYVSGSAGSLYQFSYVLSGGESEVIVMNVAGGGDSYIGDSHNRLPADVIYRFSLKTDENGGNLGDIRDNLDGIINNPDATEQEKQEAAIAAAAAVQGLGLDGTQTALWDMEDIAAVERAYILHNPAVLPTRIDSPYVNASVKGAALSIPADSTEASGITIAIEKGYLPEELPADLDINAVALEIRMDLEKGGGAVWKGIQPLAPMELTFVLPEGIRTDGPAVFHYHDKELKELPMRVNGRRVSVIITELSTFVVANRKQEAPNPDPASDGSESSYSGSASTPKLMTGQWIEDGKGWWFRQADGGYPADTWAYIGGKWYHFDGGGYMQTGWFHGPDGRWYYLKEDGSMASSEWILYQGKWYYLNLNGDMAVSAKECRTINAVNRIKIK